MKTILYYFSKNIQKKEKEQLERCKTTVDDEVEAFFEIPFLGKDGNPLSLNVYRSKKETKEKRPVIIDIHGGGLFVGNKMLAHSSAQEFAKRGFLVFCLDYRLLTDADACSEISDVCAGFCKVEQLIEEFGGNKNAVNVVAESAGAYLALYSIAAHKSSKLKEVTGCQVSGLNILKLACFSGMFYTEKIDLIGVLYPIQIYGFKCFNRKFMKFMNPENEEVYKALPPILMTSSDADFLKKYTLRYHSFLVSKGHECKLMFYTGNKGLIHAFPSYRFDMKETFEVIDELSNNFFALR